MELFQITLVLAAFLCSLVSGFLFAFAVVVMAGIRKLDDREFIRAFQSMDGIIQNNQPMFVGVWLGSVVALLVATAVGVGRFDAMANWLLIVSAVVYLIGVQLPTFTINIPLNNSLQALNADSMDDAELEAARETFEGRWNRWNVIRTVASCLISLLLMGLLLRV